MKIKFGAIVTDGRNKIGGHVASKNKAGNYLKTKSSPANPNTSYQASVRQDFGSLAQSWRGLTQIQRNSWLSGAPNFPYTDIFGDTKILSGFSLYMQLNSNLNAVSASLLTTCPAPASVTPVTALNFENDPGNSVTVYFSASPVPSGHKLVVSATPALGAGLSFSKSKIRFIKSFAAAVLSPQPITTEFAARFGLLSADANFYGGVHNVLLSTGQVSPISLIKGIDS